MQTVLAQIIESFLLGTRILIVRTLVVALIGYGWPPNHCIGYLGIQKFLLP